MRGHIVPTDINYTQTDSQTDKQKYTQTSAKNEFYKKCALQIEHDYSDLTSRILSRLSKRYNSVMDIPEDKLILLKRWVLKGKLGETVCLRGKLLSELPEDLLKRIITHYLKKLEFPNDISELIMDAMVNEIRLERKKALIK